MLPYFRSDANEENPAMGWRAIRLTLDRPGLLRTQVRALLKAAGGRELRLMLPMVTEVAEVRKASELINREVQHLSRFAHNLPTRVKIGAMVEVPSLLWQLDELMSVVDFVSVGSNDLFQFVMAVDRGNSIITNRFDNLSVPFLRVLRQIAEAGNRNHTDVTLCGEMAGKPLSAMALIGLGYRSISMSPASIGPIKAMLGTARRGRTHRATRRCDRQSRRNRFVAPCSDQVRRASWRPIVRFDEFHSAGSYGSTAEAFLHDGDADGEQSRFRNLCKARFGVFRA